VLITKLGWDREEKKKKEIGGNYAPRTYVNCVGTSGTTKDDFSTRETSQKSGESGGRKGEAAERGSRRGRRPMGDSVMTQTVSRREDG